MRYSILVIVQYVLSKVFAITATGAREDAKTRRLRCWLVMSGGAIFFLRGLRENLSALRVLVRKVPFPVSPGVPTGHELLR